MCATAVALRKFPGWPESINSLKEMLEDLTYLFYTNGSPNLMQVEARPILCRQECLQYHALLFFFSFQPPHPCPRPMNISQLAFAVRVLSPRDVSWQSMNGKVWQTRGGTRSRSLPSEFQWNTPRFEYHSSLYSVGIEQMSELAHNTNDDFGNLALNADGAN